LKEKWIYQQHSKYEKVTAAKEILKSLFRYKHCSTHREKRVRKKGILDIIGQ
jgi:hypothetical protein